MQLQEAITESVSDKVYGFRDIAGMLTHDEIRAELIRQIDRGEIKQADVARHLSVAPARINEIRNQTRRIQPDEMPKLARFLGMVHDTEIGKTVAGSSAIPIVGRVAQGVWLEQSEIGPDDRQTVEYDRRAGEPEPKDLFALIPEGSSMNLRFPEGMILICRPVPFGNGSYKSGDYVIAERTAHDLRELTCKRIEVDEDGTHWLHSESSDPRYADPWPIGKPDKQHHTDHEIRIVARVVRAVLDFERH